jgi:hypothetical protein
MRLETRERLYIKTAVTLSVRHPWFLPSLQPLRPLPRGDLTPEVVLEEERRELGRSGVPQVTRAIGR